MKSIIPQKECECYLCHSFCNTEEHHLICGTAQRIKSEKYGLKISICRSCHSKIHDKGWRKKELEAFAQVMFEQTYPDLDFYEIFGRYYK